MQTTPELRLILTLEHLPAHDVLADQKWTFGLVLSVASMTALPTAQRGLLRPWEWNFMNPNQGLHYQIGVGDPSVLGPVSTTPAPFEEPMFNGCALSSFDSIRRKAFEALQVELNQIPENRSDDLEWGPELNERRVSRSITSGVVTADGEKRRPWHTILGQASRYAAPIPQLLNLSHIFRISIPSGLPSNTPITLFAAPVIQTGGPFPQRITPVATGPTLWANHGGIHLWRYDLPAMGDIPVVAYLMPARIRNRVSPTTSLFDFGSLWVNRPPEDNDSEDWRATLEQKMADALDLGARVLEASRPRITGDGNNRPDALFVPSNRNRVAVERLVLASLRDLAGIGYREPPGGRSLINMALATYSTATDRVPLVEPFEQASKPMRQLIEQRVAAEFGGDTGLRNWKGLIRATIEELAGSPVLSGDTENISGREDIQDPDAFERSLNDLEHIRQAVFRPGNLERLVRAQWKLIAEKTDALSRLNGLAERAEFPVLDPRNLLAKENLWSVWRDFLRLIQPTNSDLSGRTSVVENFPRLFQSYFRQRFGQAVHPAPDCADGTFDLPQAPRHPPIPMPTPPIPIPGDLIRAVCQEIQYFSTRFAPALVARGAVASTTVEPTEVPHAITIQVDSLGRLHTPQEEVSNQEDDLLDQISGIGVLMREAPAGANHGRGWKCLNIAAPRFRRSDDPLEWHPTENLLTLVPLRMVYQNDLRAGTVTYNNHPISSTSPVDELSQNVQLEAPRRDSLRSSAASDLQGDNVKPIVSYFYPSPMAETCASGTAATPFLPGLKFGSRYEVLPFLITNSGSLPRELAPNPSHPYSPNLGNFDSQSAAVNPVVVNKIRRFQYLRRVRVGELRVLRPESAQANIRIEYPPTPEEVALRLRDLNTAAFLPEGTPAQERTKEHPLILLRPQAGEWTEVVRHSFSFDLRKPGTDINTWDRWVARDDTNRQLRKDVWAAYYFESDRKAANPSGPRTPDVSLDDPAVDDHVYLELAEVDGTATVQTVQRWARYPISAPDPNTLTPFRKGTVAVTCTADETFGFGSPSTDPRNVTIHLTKGRLYRLTAWSCVAVSDRSRFDNIFPSTMPVEVTTPAGTRVLRVSPLTMFFEVATDRLLADDELAGQGQEVRQILYDSLYPTFNSGTETSLRVQFVRPTPINQTPPLRAFRYIQRVELSRQVWRWQGREAHPHPRIALREPAPPNHRDYAREIKRWEASTTYTDAVEEWEEREFGNRSELDRLVVQMETTTDNATGRRSFDYVERLAESPTSAQNSVAASELRALHYRFSIVAFSRYASLLRRGGFEVSARLDGAANPSIAPRTTWKPLFVPCRQVALSDPPKIKFILPLTDSFGESNKGSAGALVVFDEPWHEIGGLGETLTAEVETIQDPRNANSLAFEAGPDPLVGTVIGELAKDNPAVDPSDPAARASDDIVIVPANEIKGAIGHTFDRSDDAAFFNATSFIVPAPTATRVEPGQPNVTPAYQVPWSFAKLRFRRTILRRTSNDGKPDEIHSPFTQSFWVQFIPEFSVVSLAFKLGDLRLRQDSNNQVTIVDLNGREVSLPPLSAGGGFERYLVLTRRVVDARGKMEEAYVAAFSRIGAAGWRLMDFVTGVPRTIPPAPLKLRARIMEVQRHRTATAITSEQNLWSSIFSPATKDSDRLRIVAVSNPIDSL